MLKRIILLSVCVAFIGCAKAPLYTESRALLGTVVTVSSPYPEAAGIVFKELERVEKIFSIKRDDSAIAHLNKTGYLNTHFEVTYLVEKAFTYHQLTQGLFDITILPVLQLWEESLKANLIPNDEEMKAALDLVGMSNVRIDKTTNSIKFLKKGMGIDLGAILKGYAVDSAVKELKRKGIDSALINAGGDVYALGTKGGQLWNVGIFDPRQKNKICQSVDVKDAALSTAGDYDQCMDIKGKKYSRIINPKTGYPLSSSAISVTVRAKDVLTANAVAMSVYLLGPDMGKRVFKYYPGVEDIIIISR